ncbi:hypothetical protein PR202_ga18942 [Eleusine coracana subsp. coracana]|uniref:Helicase ATP-binding domain-containing protein n=1 Tax=Eleusine coracana subsp. coracana TaxID=191504 RepID=A0AAV5CU35_ELECO|nr:hypothetical protein PR202_ga18942 [Eleusine coracana subsp. coracana]
MPWKAQSRSSGASFIKADIRLEAHQPEDKKPRRPRRPLVLWTAPPRAPGMARALPQIWRWLRRFRWPAELRRLFSPRRPARRGEPNIADAAAPRLQPRQAIAGKISPPPPETGGGPHRVVDAKIGDGTSMAAHKDHPFLFCKLSDDDFSANAGRRSARKLLRVGPYQKSPTRKPKKSACSLIRARGLCTKNISRVSAGSVVKRIYGGCHVSITLQASGGILADEQSLGKTIVVIALILKEINQQSKFIYADSGGAAIVVGKMGKSMKKQGATTMLSAVFHQEAAPRTTDVKLFVEDRNPSPPSILSSWDKPTGGTLVVCPKSILTQWDEEIRRVAKNFGLSVFVYHGHSRNVDPEELAKHDVVLTSYGMVKQQFDSRKKGIAKKPSGTDDPNTGPIARDLQQACNHPCLVKKRDHQQWCTIHERSYVSSKIKATMNILNSVINKNAIIESGRTTESGSSESAPEKVLVFSQFTRMLDLLEPILNSSHIQFRRLDGKMTRQARDKAVKDFNRKPKVLS